MPQEKPKPPSEGHSEFAFGEEDAPPSLFNRIAQSGLHFVRDVLENGTKKGTPSLELESAQKPGTPSFNKDEHSQVHEYTPTWDSEISNTSPRDASPPPPEEFTKFNSAMRDWNAHQADRAFIKKQQHKIVYRSAPKKSVWRIIFTMLFLGLVTIGGLYVYRFASGDLISEIKAKMGARGNAVRSESRYVEDKESVKKSPAVKPQYKKSNKRYNQN